MLPNTRLTLKALSLLALTSLFTNPTLAAPDAHQPSSSGWSWSAHVGTLNIDSEIAEQQGIDDSAWVIGVAAERYSSNSNLTFLIGADFIGYGDNYSFSQDTNKGEKDSDASGALLYVEFGPHIPFGKDDSSYFVAHAGVSGMLNSERGISYCENCYSEDIKVDGGFYGVLGVGHSFGNFDLGLQFQQYFSGDLDNSLRLRISSSF